MAEATKSLHISEPFSIQTVVPGAKGERPTLSYETFNRGDAVLDTAAQKRIEDAYASGLIGHNHYRMVVTPAVETPKAADTAPVVATLPAPKE